MDGLTLMKVLRGYKDGYLLDTPGALLTLSIGTVGLITLAVAISLLLMSMETRR